MADGKREDSDIREMRGSNIGRDVNYPDRDVPWFFSVPISKLRETTFKLGHNSFLPDPFQFINRHHPVSVADSFIT
jgi:hypothetical protein